MMMIDIFVNDNAMHVQIGSKTGMTVNKDIEQDMVEVADENDKWRGVKLIGAGN